MGHLASILFASEAGIDATYVGYRGAAPLIADLLGGQVDIGMPAYGSEANAAKLLAVATDRRVEFLPDVPTMRESGYGQVMATTWNAIFAPAGLPQEIVVAINRAIDAFVQREETRRQFGTFGFRVLGGSPSRLSRQIAEDRARWSKIIQSANISIDR
jgi:tripartite-type tricarboxylate transporter receptor subunit TctC